MGLPVTDAQSAAAFIGVGATDDGKEAMEAAAQKAGISVDDLISQLNLFGQMVRHLDAANESDAGLKGESFARFNITKQALQRIIREEYTTNIKS